MMTYKELYAKGIEILEKAQVPDARYDARILLEKACNISRTTLMVHGEDRAKETEEEGYFSWIETRASRIPLQHILGQTEFMGLSFYVDENVLCPRQDTEILVEEVLQHLHDGMHILDMCTGSGCILLSLLHYSNDCQGVGVDLSEKALEVAKKNAEHILSKQEQLSIESVHDDEGSDSALQITQNVQFLQSNLFEEVEGNFEIIVSNPPYIPSQIVDTLMPEVKDHEPRMALDGTEDGLYFYREITKSAVHHLCGGGMLFYEIGYDQAQAVKEMMEASDFREVTVVKDYAGLDRVVYGTKM